MKNTQQRIDEDEDFIAIKKFRYSLNRLLAKYPDGAPPKIVAQALMMTEEEAEELFQSAIVKLREAMKVELD